MAAENLISFNNPVFVGYAFYSAILVLKMLGMSFLTAKHRLTKKVFANPEDVMSKKGGVKFDDPDVERVRRAHRNDMENIPLFFVIGFLYVLTNPSYFAAINAFRVFAIGRIVHSIVYAVVVLPQPARGLSFFAGVGSTAFMASQVILRCL